MQNTECVISLDSIAGARLLHDLQSCKWRVFRLPSGIASKSDFFDAVRSTLPLDPTIHGQHSWDALSDSLWSGLDSVEEPKMALVWPDASRLRKFSPQDFETALNVLKDVASTLNDAKATAGATKLLKIILIDPLTYD